MRALLSVYDKTGLVPFARHLVSLGFELVSTDGTARTLAESEIPVLEVAEVTGFPEMLDGRVKTLHPHIHAGLLARRSVQEHMAQLSECGIQPIDVLASNLYPFENSVGRADLDDDAKIEQIDIGGPAMVRAAAKNFDSITVITDPSDYAMVAKRLEDRNVDVQLRRSLAAKAFAHVATYDSLVAEYLRVPSQLLFPSELAIGLRHDRDLRYGENPQQRAAAYRRLPPGEDHNSVLDAIQIAGPELSFNNLLDADAAWQAVRISTSPTVSIVKHTIPCGLATRPSLAGAFDAALDGDPISAFGGIVALNGKVSPIVARRLIETRFDMVIAVDFTEDAVDILRTRRNIRILNMPSSSRTGIPSRPAPLDLRPIAGGILAQEPDIRIDDTAQWNVVTKRRPDEREINDLEYAWAASRLVKSNAIVVVKDLSVRGVGAGQPNRVESVGIAVRKAGENAKGAALASDAYFPFADGLQRAIDAGVTAVVQPGGSVRDGEVIAAANRAGIAMVCTGTRHFRH